MKICVAQQNYIIGDFAYNTRKIIDAIQEAKRQQADLVLFSELAVCGYPPRDLLTFDDFITACEKAVDAIRKEADTIAVLVGAPSRNPDPEGKDLYNSAFFLYEQEIRQVISKSLLPNYDIFDEYRYFEPAGSHHCVSFQGKRLAVTICEDIWDLVANPLYDTVPMDALMAEKPDLMLNLSASPFDYTHAEDRLATVKKNVTRYGLPMIYCNTVGSQTEIVFDGGSLIVDEKGNLIRQLDHFREELAIVEWSEQTGFGVMPEAPADSLPDKVLAPGQLQPDLHIDRIYEALILGIREYFSKMGFQKAVVASSGGIDSAVVLTLACRALGADHVQALLMPSPFSTGHSVADAEQLSRNLHNPFAQLPITPVYEAATRTLATLFAGRPFDIAEENIQARIRGMLAMAYSNKFNTILLNTSNKSELACGYGTLYGDMAGGLSVIGDLYKTQVYALAQYINRQKPDIPDHILTKPPSAELRPGQTDADSLPDYDLLDDLLYRYIECGQSHDDLLRRGYDQNLIQRVLQMVHRSEYKRGQFCPVIRISPKSFGVGRRMPIVGKYLS